MFKNYFKTAWRNILKNKISSPINISGLAIGMAVAMLVGLWIWHELSFDTYNKKDFVLMMFISFLIATPIAHYFTHNWLQNYEYRPDLSWWIFAAAGFGALMITLVTVSFQSIKAALANPVKSLRTE